MYEIVKSVRQQKQFKNTWEYFCDFYGWHNDPYAKNGIRYNLLLPSKRKKVIGTIEFIPYNSMNPDSTVEGKFQFSRFDFIMSHPNRVWEIDKLCLHGDFHRQGYFENFMHVFYDHSKRHQPKYYIGLMEKRLFRMLRISFGLGLKQAGEALVGPSTALIPFVFDIEVLLQDKETVRMLLSKSKFSEKDKVPKSPRVSLFNIHSTNNLFRRLFNHIDKKLD
ncbi:MAG TPA: hypothetical protein GXX18_11920 [Bacillales bacterium]|nr:hypothetical protein [Bacillales bacterium]